MNQIELHPWNQRKPQLESCNKHGIVVEGMLNLINFS